MKKIKFFSCKKRMNKCSNYLEDYSLERRLQISKKIFEMYPDKIPLILIPKPDSMWQKWIFWNKHTKKKKSCFKFIIHKKMYLENIINTISENCELYSLSGDYIRIDTDIVYLYDHFKNNDGMLYLYYKI